MLDWGICATIIACISFISCMISENKMKQLNNKVAELEKKVDLEDGKSF